MFSRGRKPTQKGRGLEVFLTSLTYIFHFFPFPLFSLLLSSSFVLHLSLPFCIVSCHLLFALLVSSSSLRSQQINPLKTSVVNPTTATTTSLQRVVKVDYQLRVFLSSSFCFDILISFIFLLFILILSVSPRFVSFCSALFHSVPFHSYLTSFITSHH